MMLSASKEAAAKDNDDSNHNHCEKSHFANSFSVLGELRQEGTLTDITLKVNDNNNVLAASAKAHKLVLMAASDYFRTMFKACFTESGLDSLSLHGVEADILEPLVDYFYTGTIRITNDNVMSLLEAASLLLLPNLVQSCGRYLSNSLDVSNCLRILAIATSCTFGLGLEWLEEHAIRFSQLHFEAIWRSPEFIGRGATADSSEEERDVEENYDDEASFMLTSSQLTRLLEADDLCVDSEESVYYCVTRWVNSLSRSNNCHDADGLANLIKDEPALIHLWEAVRFPQLSSTFLAEVVQTSQFLTTIEQTESYQNVQKAKLMPTASRTWSRSIRTRGHNLDIIVAHADGHNDLEYFNTANDDRWSRLTSLPEGCPTDGLALAGHRSRIFLVGGNASTGRIINDYTISQQQGRGCFIYDLEKINWIRGPSLQQPRWNHGLVRIGEMLYAVGGCGQQNSMEAVSLVDLEAGWAPRPSMEVRRHIPGVSVLDGLIYVVGGADSQWAAHTTVECFHPGENVWIRLPDMHCPRAQPAVAGLNGLLYAIGGRNSKKVELKSVECYDPLNNTWTLLDDSVVGSLRKKRWASAAVAFREDNIIVMGGRGKWASNTVEVFCPLSRQWSLAKHGVGGVDKRYSACLVTRPYDRWTCPH